MTAPTKFEQTHISLVLDRSGSMEACRGPTITMVNKYLAEARGDSALKESDFLLTIFDTMSIDDIRAGAPISFQDISEADFVPRGGTPLYDAIGRGIDSLERRCKASGSGKAILVIVTDGQENSSKLHNKQAIQERIKSKEAAGWLIVFLGSNLDVASQGLGLGFNQDMVASMDMMSETSMASVGRSLAASTQSYAAHKTSAAARAHALSGASSFSGAARASMGDPSKGAMIFKQASQQQPGAPTPPPVVIPVAPDETDVWSNNGDNWSK